MLSGRRTESFTFSDGSSRQAPRAKVVEYRDLSRDKLAGVVFGATFDTMAECLDKLLFGLPRGHFKYVQHITEGLPLFLFHYGERMMYGIFVAASEGDLDIDPHAWMKYSRHGACSFPAQVRVKLAKKCNPLPEDMFREILSANYYGKKHFQFELDYIQTQRLIAMLEANTVRILPTIMPPKQKSAPKKTKSEKQKPAKLKPEKPKPQVSNSFAALNDSNENSLNSNSNSTSNSNSSEGPEGETEAPLLPVDKEMRTSETLPTNGLETHPIPHDSMPIVLALSNNEGSPFVGSAVSQADQYPPLPSNDSQESAQFPGVIGQEMERSASEIDVSLRSSNLVPIEEIGGVKDASIHAAILDLNEENLPPFLHPKQEGNVSDDAIESVDLKLECVAGEVNEPGLTGVEEASVLSRDAEMQGEIVNDPTKPGGEFFSAAADTEGSEPSVLVSNSEGVRGDSGDGEESEGGEAYIPERRTAGSDEDEDEGKWEKEEVQEKREEGADERNVKEQGEAEGLGNELEVVKLECGGDEADESIHVEMEARNGSLVESDVVVSEESGKAAATQSIGSEGSLRLSESISVNSEAGFDGGSRETQEEGKALTSLTNIQESSVRMETILNFSPDFSSNDKLINAISALDFGAAECLKPNLEFVKDVMKILIGGFSPELNNEVQMLKKENQFLKQKQVETELALKSIQEEYLSLKAKVDLWDEDYEEDRPELLTKVEAKSDENLVVQKIDDSEWQGNAANHEQEAEYEEYGEEVDYNEEEEEEDYYEEELLPDLFVLGGMGAREWLSDVDVYSSKTGQWSKRTNFSSPRAYAACAAENCKLFLVGGGDGSKWLNTVERYEVSTDSWHMCTPISLARGSLGASFCLGTMYCVGGGNGQSYFNEVEFYDEEQDKWFATTSMTEKRFGVSAVQFKDSILALGGYNGDNTLKSCERFDPREGKWYSLADMHVKKSSFCSAVLNDKVYVFGGMDRGVLSNVFEAYESRMNKWLRLPDIAVPRCYGAAVTIGSGFYAVGGLFGNAPASHMDYFCEEDGWSVAAKSDDGAPVSRSFVSAVAL